jgi:DNA-binding CsgD family transcriptional regulator
MSLSRRLARRNVLAHLAAAESRTVALMVCEPAQSAASHALQAASEEAAVRSSPEPSFPMDITQGLTLASRDAEPDRPSPSVLEEDRRVRLALIDQVLRVERHRQLLDWLRGPAQMALPHDMLVAGWGDFAQGALRHDILSNLPGARSYAVGTEGIAFLLAKLHERWLADGRRPCVLRVCEFDYFLGQGSLPGSFGVAVRSMQSVLVHGLTDQRTGHDCLYAFFSAEPFSPEAEQLQQMQQIQLTMNVRVQKGSASLPMTRHAAEELLPFIDTAMRRIALLPQQRKSNSLPAFAAKPASLGHSSAASEKQSLTERETQIMAWVAMGKTNSEIGSILSISGFTVKNHMQRIFQKLDVYNRAQAVSKVTRVRLDG